MKVILAQESKVVGRLLRDALRSTRYGGAPVVEVHGATEFLRALEDDSDADILVVLDANLPGADPATLLTQLRNRGILARIALLLCVNPAQVPYLENLRTWGTMELLLRPYSDEEFRSTVDRLTSRRPSGPVPEAAGLLREIVSGARTRATLPCLFALPSGTMSRLFDRSSPSHFAPGELLLDLGEPVSALSFLSCGEVEIEGPEGRTIRGAGECYSEREFFSGLPSRARVRARTRVEVVTISKESLAELACHDPVFQEFLSSLLRVPSTPALSEDEGGAELSGIFGPVGFSDLIQLLHSARKTGVLTLSGADGYGRISFDRGEVTDAKAGELRGDAAFLELAGRAEGRFRFRSGSIPETQTIHTPTLRLLMGACLEAQSA